jgi:hypothetical protein
MAEKDDARARTARAKKLRIQIDRLKKGKPAGSGKPGGRPRKESPAEFVDRRMREIAQAEKRKASGRRRSAGRRANRKSGDP